MFYLSVKVISTGPQKLLIFFSIMTCLKYINFLHNTLCFNKLTDQFINYIDISNLTYGS
jgi:hypothetical protein